MIYPFAAFLAVLLTMPLFIRMANRLGMHDRPDFERKLHQGNIPYTGGLCFILVWSIAVAVMFGFERNLLPPAKELALLPMMLYLAEAGIIILILGMMDDVHDLPFHRKFIFQFLASFFIILGAIKSNVFPKVFNVTESGVLLNSLGTMVSVFWLVGVMNAVNMIDGMDGLAGGSSVISAAVMGALALTWDNPAVALMLFVLAGALLGFLAYNISPARVFMGDTGSMFLGFLLGVLGWLLVDNGPPRLTTYFVPIIILGLPISDTLLAFARRIITRQNPFAADRFHVHHMLKQRFNLSARKTVLLLYAATIVYAGLGVLVALSPEPLGWGIIVVTLAAQLWFFHLLGYTDLVFHRPEATLRVLVHAPGHVNGNGRAALNGNGYHGVNGNGHAKIPQRPEIEPRDEGAA